MWEENWREKLRELRQGVDQTDSQILGLVNRRMKLCEEIGEIKVRHGLPVCVPEREAEVIKNRQELGRRYGLREKFVRIFFKLLMLESKKLQKNLAGV